jgi:hypothetical protein
MATQVNNKSTIFGPAISSYVFLAKNYLVTMDYMLKKGDLAEILASDPSVKNDLPVIQNMAKALESQAQELLEYLQTIENEVKKTREETKEETATARTIFEAIDALNNALIAQKEKTPTQQNAHSRQDEFNIADDARRILNMSLALKARIELSDR